MIRFMTPIFLYILALNCNVNVYFKGDTSKPKQLLMLVIDSVVCGCFILFSLTQSRNMLFSEIHYLTITGLVNSGIVYIWGKKRKDYLPLVLFFLVENLFSLYFLTFLFNSLNSMRDFSILVALINLVIQLLMTKLIRHFFALELTRFFSNKKSTLLIVLSLLLILSGQFFSLTPRTTVILGDNSNGGTSEHYNGEVVTIKNEQLELNVEFARKIFFVFITLLAAVLIYVGYEIQKTKKNQRLLSEKEMMSQYIDTLETLQLDIQKVQHDYQNLLLGINGFVMEDDQVNIKSLKAYLVKNQLMQKQGQIEMGTLERLKKLNRVELKGLISTKIIQATQKGLSVSVECTEAIEIEKVDTFDLIRLLGILLDNAIEEAEMAETGGKLAVAFIKENSTIIILIANSTEQSSTEVLKKIQNPRSTKGNNRGFGLLNVQEIITKYPNVFMETDCQNKWVKQKIVIIN